MIETLPISVLLILLCLAVGGVGVLLLLQYKRTLNLFQLHHATDRGVCDHVQAIALVDDGIIVNKNGSFTACWFYEGDDNESATAQEREALSASLNSAFKKFDGGFTLNFDACRQKAPHYPSAKENAFPDRVSFAIDEERRRLFEKNGVLYQGFFVLSLTWMPPARSLRKAGDIFFEQDSAKKDKRSESEHLIETFKGHCQRLEDALSANLHMRRLKTREFMAQDGLQICDDQLAFLQFCLTGIQQSIRLPKNPIYLDGLIGGQDVWTGVPMRIGNKYFRCVAIEGVPSESYSGILSSLADLPCECRWSTRYILLDKNDALHECDVASNAWKMASRGFFAQIFNTAGGKVDMTALSMSEDAKEAKEEVQGDYVAMGFYTSVVVLWDEDRDRLNENAQSLVKKLIDNLGFTARIESINNTDAFFGSIAGNIDANVRRPLLSSLNLADMIPTSSLWTGNEKCPNNLMVKYAGHDLPPLMHCVTTGSTPFRLNLHEGDLGHSLILGPTGSGKSVALVTLMAQALRYRDMHIFAFDKGKSAFALCEATGGNFYDVGGDNSDLAFCPLQFIDTVADRAWASSWIETIILLSLKQGERLPIEWRNAIADALETMHRNNEHTLSDFSRTVQIQEIKEIMKIYTVEGAMGQLLDAPSDSLSFDNDGTKPFFTVFEIESLMDLKDEKFILPVFLYLFRRIEKALQGQPAMITLDESWLLFQNPLVKAELTKWLKTFRKANAFVVMATQSLNDLTRSGLLDIINESCPTKIFLPNPNAFTNAESRTLYHTMGLTDRQLEIIAYSTKKRDYYFVQGFHRRLYQLALGRLALAFVGVSDKESIAKIQRLKRDYGMRWTDEWVYQTTGLRLDDYTKGFEPLEPHVLKTLIQSDSTTESA